jgi:2-phospho-L-lactate transferase/gluconeogenesis factor (CofD/UPF0052 family)
MFRALKWLYPGMRVKRWIAVIILGVLLACLGAMALIVGLLANEQVSASTRYGLAALLFLVGGVFLLTGVYRLMKSLGELLELRPGGRATPGVGEREKQLVDIAFERRYLGLGPRVVAIGGGTGMSTLLSGLKEYTAQITAVISVADDGGSSGRLRREFDMLPPGDIRKCLVALSDESPLLGDLMTYRFRPTTAGKGHGESNGATAGGSNGTPAEAEYGELAGHSFGNLFLTVLWQLTGNFSEAVRQAGRILSIRGRVVPATLDRVSLVATHQDGGTTVGQRQISESARRIRRVDMSPNPGPASQDIVDAIEGAELIVIGPGSLYTSVIPNLLIDGIVQAIRRSEAVKIFVANVASHEGETRGFTLKEHLDAMLEHTLPLPFDVVLVSSTPVSASVHRELAASGGALVRYDPRQFGIAPADVPLGARGVGADMGSGRYSKQYGVRFVEADLASHESPFRHSPAKLARALVTLLAEERDRE